MAEKNTISVNDKEWKLPEVHTLSNYEAQKIIEAIQKNDGKPLTEGEILSVIGRSNTHLNEKEREWYYSILDANSSELGYNSNVYYDENGLKNMIISKKQLESQFDREIKKPQASKSDYESMVEAAYEDRLGLMTDPTGTQAQRFRDTMYGAIAEEQAVAEQSLGQAELDAYRMLGQQQLELENTIAEQRKKALLSGTTSAQLAAGQLQNMFAAQSGAAQVAQGLANQRTQMNQTFAEKRTGVETSLYDYINQQQTIAATAGAQNLAALSSYASYANQYYNNIMGYAKAKDELGGTAFAEILKLANQS